MLAELPTSPKDSANSDWESLRSVPADIASFVASSYAVKATPTPTIAAANIPAGPAAIAAWNAFTATAAIFAAIVLALNAVVSTLVDSAIFFAASKAVIAATTPRTAGPSMSRCSARKSTAAAAGGSTVSAIFPTISTRLSKNLQAVPIAVFNPPDSNDFARVSMAV